uniref:Clarin 3 n=1 Tax=Astyanax mexicanus TaxID=7994 RepID=A0A8B9JU92_ASTMX
MPSTTKMMYFFSSALLSAGGIAILGYGMSTAWADCVMYCGPSDNNQFNGFAEIVMGLFAGGITSHINQIKFFAQIRFVYLVGSHSLYMKNRGFCSLFSHCFTYCISASLAFLALVLYLINVMVIKLGQELAKHTGDVVVKDKDMKFMTGFFLLLPYIILNLLAILLVYLYVHIDNTHRRQQEKPTEDAPKDIMMF